jgi:transposase
MPCHRSEDAPAGPGGVLIRSPATAPTTPGSQRRALQARGIRPLLARRGIGHGSGLGRARWMVERFFGWLHNSYRRLATRWEYRADIHLGFLKLACCLICRRRLEPSS